MYTTLTVQNECIIGLDVRRKKKIFIIYKNDTIILRLNGAYFHRAALDGARQVLDS